MRKKICGKNVCAHRDANPRYMWINRQSCKSLRFGIHCKYGKLLAIYNKTCIDSKISAVSVLSILQLVNKLIKTQNS